MEPQRDLPSFVYFVAAPDAGLVKIGCTGIAVERRVQQHRGGSPVPLQLLAAAPGTIDDERAIHTAFLAHHSHFEWFRLVPEVAALIDVVAKSGAIPAHLRGIKGQRNPLNGLHLQAIRSEQGRAA